MQRRLVAARCCMALVVPLTLESSVRDFQVHPCGQRGLLGSPSRSRPRWLPYESCPDRGYPSPPAHNRRPDVTRQAYRSQGQASVQNPVLYVSYVPAQGHARSANFHSDHPVLDS